LYPPSKEGEGESMWDKKKDAMRWCLARFYYFKE
jgi:hypothetical protein